MSRPPQVPVRATIAEAWRLLLAEPRRILLPSLVITVPVAFLMAVATTVGYLTIFDNEPLVLLNEISRNTAGALAFMLVAAAAIEVLFGQVARGATVMAVAGVATGKPRSLAEALDPAFTRMGAIIAQAVVLAAVGGALIFSIVGLVIFPYVAARFALSTESLLLEGRSATSALAASWSLMRGRVIRLLGVALLAALVCVGPLVLVSLLGLMVTGGRTQELVTGAVVSVLQAFLLVPVIGFLTTVTTLFYLKAKEIDGGKPAA
ncbi:MAG: hypothetical protein AB7T37_04435 [Dehalococcoidia bacterium]